MKLPFIRASKEVEVEDFYSNESDEISIKGVLKPEREIYRLDGELKGKLTLECDLCLEDYSASVDEKITLWFSDGPYRFSQNDREREDIIEFFDGFIDFDEVIRSEVESIKLDYHKCEQCLAKEEEE